MPSTMSTSSRSRGYAFASIESSICPMYAASLRHGTTIDTKGRTSDTETPGTPLIGVWPASGRLCAGVECLIIPAQTAKALPPRSEERRVGKECRSQGPQDQIKKKHDATQE